DLRFVRHGSLLSWDPDAFLPADCRATPPRAAFCLTANPRPGKLSARSRTPSLSRKRQRMNNQMTSPGYCTGRRRPPLSRAVGCRWGATPDRSAPYVWVRGFLGGAALRPFCHTRRWHVSNERKEECTMSVQEIQTLAQHFADAFTSKNIK